MPTLQQVGEWSIWSKSLWVMWLISLSFRKFILSPSSLLLIYYILEEESVVNLVSFRSFLKFLHCLISEFKKLLASGVILLLLQHFIVLPPYKHPVLEAAT